MVGSQSTSSSAFFLTPQGQGGGQGYWDEGVLEIVGGSREEGRNVDISGGGGGQKMFRDI